MTTELQQRLDALEKEAAAIRAELESQPEPEWPQKGDNYWWVSSAGDLYQISYGEFPTVDAIRQATDNMHRTPEKAKAAHQWYVENGPRLRAERIVLTRLKELGGGEFVFDE